MPIDQPVFEISQLFGLDFVFYLFRIGVILFMALYFFFSLIVLRQINLMTDTLISEVGPVLRASGILYAGLSLGLLVLMIGLLLNV